MKLLNAAELFEWQFLEHTNPKGPRAPRDSNVLSYNNFGDYMDYSARRQRNRLAHLTHIELRCYTFCTWYISYCRSIDCWNSDICGFLRSKESTSQFQIQVLTLQNIDINIHVGIQSYPCKTRFCNSRISYKRSMCVTNTPAKLWIDVCVDLQSTNIIEYWIYRLWLYIIYRLSHQNSDDMVKMLRFDQGRSGNTTQIIQVNQRSLATCLTFGRSHSLKSNLY